MIKGWEQETGRMDSWDERVRRQWEKTGRNGGKLVKSSEGVKERERWR